MEKKDRSPVTIADFASQAVICKQLRDVFSDDSIVAEEDARELRLEENALFRTRICEEIQASGLTATEEDVLSWIDFGNHDGTASRFWTLDPIDGTKGFLRKEQFAISLALIVEGEIQVAALACPNLDAGEYWPDLQGVILSAIRGKGAQIVPLDLPDATPQALRVAATDATKSARICESVESGHSSHGWSANVREKLSTTADPVRIDSQAKYAVVARGDADVYLRLPTRVGYEEKIWDHAGGVLVVEEAGGTVTDVDGKPLDFSKGSTLQDNRGVVVTNGLLHDDVLAAVSAAEH
jgi:3'(2'), 5'-bisphosphate nucleotidase